MENNTNKSPAQPPMQNAPMQNPFNEMVDFIVTPKAEDSPETEEINRDLVLSNLNEAGLRYVYNCFDLAQDIERLIPKTRISRIEEVPDPEDGRKKVKMRVDYNTKGTVELERFRLKLIKNAITYSIVSRSRNGFERLAQNTTTQKSIFKESSQPKGFGFLRKKEKGGE